MKTLKKALADVADDLWNIEVAVLLENPENPESDQILSYSKFEVGGDSIHLMNSTGGAHSEELRALVDELTLTCIRGRRAARNIITEALS